MRARRVASRTPARAATDGPTRRVTERPKAWVADLLDVLLPAGCVACRSWIPGGRSAPYVCPRCLSRLRDAPWPRCERCHHPLGTGRPQTASCSECADWPSALTAARYAQVLAPPANDLVHALKYEGWHELATFMGDALARLTAPGDAEAAGRTVVVPIPTSAERLRARGYNQAELLARRFAEVRNLPFFGALVRRRARRSQTSLTPAERRENVRGVFAPAPGGVGRIRGVRVLLVDDVLTTGATAAEAASTLTAAGADSVTLLAYGRALAMGPENALQALS